MPVAPTVSYLICTTPRSGSWLLCDALTQTGVAGNPQEYLLTRVGGRPAVFDDRWGKPTFANLSGYLALVREEATTPNGVCGIKVHWSQLQDLLNVPEEDPAGLLQRLRAELPGLVLIRLKRWDKLRQALSYWRALARQQWWEFADEPGSSEQFVPDLEGVGRLADLLEAHERRWDAFTATESSPPLELWYEELAADLPGNVCRVLLALGCDIQVAWSAVQGLAPRLRRQSDDRADLWVHQFISWRRRALPLTSRGLEVV